MDCRRRPARGLAASIATSNFCAAISYVAAGCAIVFASAQIAQAAEPTSPEAAASFKKDVRPILVENCFACHGDGEKNGGISFDELEAQGKLLDNRDVWYRALKNVRSKLMPPVESGTLSAQDVAKLEGWIKHQAFKLDPAAPDPGRVTLRRINRSEYRNTIRDLLGVDYKVDEQFPTDDTGHGFDNIADVLTVSPMLLEKYMVAANQVVTEVVPLVPKVVAEQTIPGNVFQADGPEAGINRPGRANTIELSYYDAARAAYGVDIKQAGKYRVIFHLLVQGRYAERAFDYNRATVGLGIDGKEIAKEDYGWREKQDYYFPSVVDWQAGVHQLDIDINPTTALPARPGVMKVTLVDVKLEGPLESKYWVKPKNHEKYFGTSEIPADPQGRRQRATEILGDFAFRAFRRPVDAPTVQRLVALAESIYSKTGQTFEAGIAHAMTATLASPRFLFLEEAAQPSTSGDRYPLLDEFSLATRLSYFLWSSTPDDELMRLAKAGELRKNLDAQVKRMLADSKAAGFYENFPGQWLEARDVQQVPVERNRIMDRNSLRNVGVATDDDFNALRLAMRRETEQYFTYVVREDRSILELINGNYSFLNERLAKYYGVPGVSGEEIRKVDLPADSPRGGVLTMGTTLMVTSNPTRTSPVKRGLFLLENILGSPPPPAPPNIPALEEASKAIAGRTPTLRETLEIHRANPSCMECHSRLDPPGLALENFNALGVFRKTDSPSTQPIDSTGTLVTGEKFEDIRELKQILARDHKQEVYRCLTEKLLTYALGRGVEYYDVETTDKIVAALDKDGGRFSTLLNGIIDSAAFQRRRAEEPEPSGAPSASAADRVDNRN